MTMMMIAKGDYALLSTNVTVPWFATLMHFASFDGIRSDAHVVQSNIALWVRTLTKFCVTLT